MGFGKSETPNNKEYSLKTHVENLENLVLVGHSFAGSILSGLADRLKDKIKLLIYFDSIILWCR